MMDLTAEQRDILARYIRGIFVKADYFNTMHTAYGLKQRFSRTHFYVTSQQFTEAMIAEGFAAKFIGDDDACFNISEKSPFERM